MYTKNVFAAGALLSVVAAVPMAKRDVVMVTETEAKVVTVPVTHTVWLNPGETAPAATHEHWGHHHGHPQFTPAAASSTESSAESTSAAAVSSSYEAPSSSSVYVAPTTSSSSVYVAPTTSSVYVAPTTSSVYVAPTTSSTWVAPTTSSTWVAPTTSEAPAPSSYAAPSSSSAAPASGTSPSGSSYTGDITHYTVGMGSCGWTNTDSEAIVAIPHGMMNNGINPNNNPLCGEHITISYNGVETQAKVVDTCGGCDGSSIDLSPTLFETVAPNGDGRVHDVTWWFNSS